MNASCSVCALMELRGSKRGRICWSGKLARIKCRISRLWGRIWCVNTHKPVRSLMVLAGTEALCDNCCSGLLGTRCSVLATYRFKSSSVNNMVTKIAGFLYLFVFLRKLKCQNISQCVNFKLLSIYDRVCLDHKCVVVTFA